MGCFLFAIFLPTFCQPARFYSIKKRTYPN
nr:MAG TPA: Herpesvirus UL41A [Caudoviricetes sp.]